LGSRIESAQPHLKASYGCPIASSKPGGLALAGAGGHPQACCALTQGPRGSGHAAVVPGLPALAPQIFTTHLPFATISTPISPAISCAASKPIQFDVIAGSADLVEDRKETGKFALQK
jgi:hypothetical protein